ncbi:Gfo/Idh/MocA family oxidoreductase [Bacillaceae bacterium Marseille-Q3522]|nr:Gfo/Idh/MocA family oxidoreductase [Bacillaceae bacterium Marseille-Q3522]
MTVRLGVLGTGAIGKDHIERITNRLSGALITSVYDINRETAENAVQTFHLEAKIFEDDNDLIYSNDVDAILICSRNDAHLAPILKAIEAGKPVFTEKPMTTTAEESYQVVQAEIAKQKRFIQVGFMRRFDPGYQALKKIVESGRIGKPLLGNCRHFCAQPPTSYFETVNVVNDAFIHEIDILHYLFNENYKSIEMKFSRENSTNPNENLRDPHLAIVEMESGALVTVELNMNSHYGYDIQCRIVGELGTASLPEVSGCELRLEGERIYPLHKDWSLRFVKAYDNEIQSFIEQVEKGASPNGPTAWDGYIASVTSDAAIRSLNNQEKVQIELKETPELYLK